MKPKKEMIGIFPIEEFWKKLDAERPTICKECKEGYFDCLV